MPKLTYLTKFTPHSPTELARLCAFTMTFGCLIWNLDVLTFFDLAPIEESFQAFVLGLALSATFLTYGIGRNENQRLHWFDAFLAVSSIGLLWYVSWNFVRLKEDGYST